MNGKVQIGTCGFNGTKAQYSERFSCVEPQQTFYQPPQIATLERWRKNMPDDFEFTLKAWQLITHEAKSPTYKRLKRDLSGTEQREAGYFKASAIVQEAWAVTLACARALHTKTILFQCPASFNQTGENIANMTRFFTHIDRENLNIGWEPRGTWDSETIKDICHDLNLWHVVDPFVNRTLTPNRCYYRLHGRQGWRYTYEEQELADLVELLPADSRSYVFFNNIRMTQDALTFKHIFETQSADSESP